MPESSPSEAEFRRPDGGKARTLLPVVQFFLSDSTERYRGCWNTGQTPVRNRFTFFLIEVAHEESHAGSCAVVWCRDPVVRPCVQRHRQQHPDRVGAPADERCDVAPSEQRQFRQLFGLNPNTQIIASSVSGQGLYAVYDAQAVPEPTSCLLLATGAAGLLHKRLRHRSATFLNPFNRRAR